MDYLRIPLASRFSSLFLFFHHHHPPSPHCEYSVRHERSNFELSLELKPSSIGTNKLESQLPADVWPPVTRDDELRLDTLPIAPPPPSRRGVSPFGASRRPAPSNGRLSAALPLFERKSLLFFSFLMFLLRNLAQSALALVDRPVMFGRVIERRHHCPKVLAVAQNDSQAPFRGVLVK